MNELHKHKSADRVKWVFTFTALFLIVVMLIGMCLQLFGSENQKPSNWFDDEDKNVDTTEENKQLNGGMTLDIPDVSASLALSSYSIPQEEFSAYGVSAAAESAVTITATLTPADATNKNLNWSLAWMDSNAEFANGKVVTEYLNIASHDGLSVNIECLKPFGEQIILTVVSEENTNATATCNFHYEKRLVSIDLGFESDDYVTEDLTSYELYRLRSYNGLIPSLKVVWSDGTINRNYIDSGVLVTTLSDSLYSLLYSINQNTEKSSTGFMDCVLGTASSKEININDIYAFLNGESDDAWYNAFYSYCNSNSQEVHATISMTYFLKNRRGLIIERGTVSCNLIFSSDLLSKSIESVSLSESIHVFSD